MNGAMPIGHHIKALAPALRIMETLGHDANACLRGTGIDQRDLLVEPGRVPFTLDQEFRFHRNLLELSGDPLLGLQLGRAYTVETYGLLGYAFLSAPTLRHAMAIVRSYGPLSFTLFTIDFRVRGGAAILRFAPYIDIPPDLLTFYVDRDLSATQYGGEQALQTELKPLQVVLMHRGRAAPYGRHFGCPVTVGAAVSELYFDVALLDAPMPLRDAETCNLCQQQCQMLLARLSRHSDFTDRVRQVIVSRPGYFPDIDFVAEKLHMSSRTLRRRLAAEGSSYARILDEIRYQLARDYLSGSRLPLEEIAALLGYSAPGNFSNAFRRWHGCPPREFRQLASGDGA